MSTITYDLEADSGDLVREAHRGAAALGKLETSGNRATKATKKVGTESSRTTTLLKAFKAGAEGVGGAAGANAGRIEKFGQAFGGVSAAAGPVGVAVGAAAVGVAAMGGAAIAAALNVSKLVEEMEKSGQNVPITDAQLAQVHAMDREIEGLKDDFQQMVVVVGTEVAPAIGSLVGGFRDAWVEARKLNEQLGFYKRIATGVLSLGGTEVWRMWSEGSEELGAYNQLQRESRRELEKLMEGTEEVGFVAVRRTKDMRQAHRDYLDQLKEEQRVQEELEALYRSAADSVLTEEEQIIVAYDRRIAKIGELVNAGGDQFVAAAARAAAEAQMQHELADLQAKLHEERMKQTRERTQAEMQAAGSIAGAIGMVADHYAQATNEMTASAKRRALVAFRISQAAAIAQIGINTAQAIMQSYAQLGPVAGNFAAVGMTATGAAQSALVLAESPPQFDQGGMVAPDHRLISAAPGEGVLTRNGVRNLGGPEAVDEMNQGGTRGRVTVEQVYRHRVLDRVLVDNIKRGGPLARQLQPDRIGHSARRR